MQAGASYSLIHIMGAMLGRAAQQPPHTHTWKHQSSFRQTEMFFAIYILHFSPFLFHSLPHSTPSFVNMTVHHYSSF